MPKLVLTYFDFDAGRGEPARLAFYIGGVSFEDRRISPKDWAQHRDQMPLQAMPVLEVDGMPVTQSNAIVRYAGKLAGLYPQDALQALLCDELLDASEDLGSRIGATIQMSDEAQKKNARLALAEGAIPRHLRYFAQRLEAAGGNWFSDQRLTVADIKIFGLVNWLRSGALDHIPKDLVDRVAPTLVQHAERVRREPKIAAYYQARKKPA
ncbi:glutathione S-transferase [Solimonas aquatica]|uniref:Glutathione S-transferase n=1 Tax=Solimonas aquatica TaxID=489703 RepID=A0A1H9GG19_9GAMM|nr:glutathione S-transferase [Solimonas aquatica]SEQ48983.1 glutathione S-transferase [Solimonas aquatica]